MALRRAKNAEEYIDWIKQAVFEVQDLRECLEFEMEDLQRFPAFLGPLQDGINAVYQSMKTGTYAFGREDLAFMDVAATNADEIPFYTLLRQINETHRKGLEVDEAED
jgi:hypothetical protein